MDCAWDVNKVKIKNKTGHETRRLWKESPHADAAAVTNKAICKRKTGAWGNHTERKIIYGWPIRLLLRGRGTQWVSLQSFVLPCNQEDTILFSSLKEYSTQPDRDGHRRMPNTGCLAFWVKYAQWGDGFIGSVLVFIILCTERNLWQQRGVLFVLEELCRANWKDPWTSGLYARSWSSRLNFCWALLVK